MCVSGLGLGFKWSVEGRMFVFNLVFSNTLNVSVNRSSSSSSPLICSEEGVS